MTIQNSSLTAPQSVPDIPITGEVADVFLRVPKVTRGCRQLAAFLDHGFSCHVVGTKREYRLQILADHTIAFVDALSHVVRRAFRRRVELIVDSESFAWALQDVAAWKPTSRRRARVWLASPAQIEAERQRPAAQPTEADNDDIGAVSITIPPGVTSRIPALVAAIKPETLTISADQGEDDHVDVFAVCRSDQFDRLLATTKTIVERDLPGSALRATPPLEQLAHPRCIRCAQPITAVPVSILATNIVRQDGRPSVAVACPDCNPKVAVVAFEEKESFS